MSEPMTLREHAQALSSRAESIAGNLDAIEYRIHDMLFGPYPAEARKSDAVSPNSVSDELVRLEHALNHISGVSDRLAILAAKVDQRETGNAAVPELPRSRAYASDTTAPARQAPDVGYARR